MNEQQILEELVSILETNGVQVRDEPLDGQSGGLCVFRGKRVFFLDSMASSADSASLCATAVAQTVDIEELYMKPQVRQFIEFTTPDVEYPDFC
jgi:hypothetical protein